VAIAAAVTIVFAVTPLDIRAAQAFYRNGGADHWPLASQVPWSVLYRAAPWMTASLMLVGLGALLCGWIRQHDSSRRLGVFVLLAVLVGPGLLVNFAFKDHWGRPRPRDIVAFAGPMPYVPAPLRGPGGTSFPCGHCSVGFLYGLGWWVWRQRRPRWAWASLALGLITGAALGVGRMAAGGHFLSDVLWSAIIAYAVAHALYYYVLRLPRLAEPAFSGEPRQVEPSPVPQRSRWLALGIGGVAAACGIGVLLAVFVFPHGSLEQTDVQLNSLPASPVAFIAQARQADVRVEIVDTPAATIGIVAELHGFGLPGSRLQSKWSFERMPEPRLLYRIDQRGWFTDLSADVRIRLPRASFRQVHVEVVRGNIVVTDATHEHVVAAGRLVLQLQAPAGHVRVN
jgi:membrane-associated PAP2 superfamily phosphatase